MESNATTSRPQQAHRVRTDVAATAGHQDSHPGICPIAVRLPILNSGL
jgi:hypothetical protein